MTPRAAPSIADVAALAGVSPTTVSHVRSGNRPVSAQTATIVRAAMSELGYVPSHAAKSLRLGLAQAIGLLVPDVTNPFFAEIAKGAEDAAEARDLSLILCSTDFDPRREARYLTMLRGGSIDGLIYAAGAPPGRDELVRLARSTPLVVLDEELPIASSVTVVSDNRKGGFLVGEHLASLGHRRVLYAGGSRRLVTSSQRLEGLVAGLGRADAQVEARWGDYREPSGFDILCREISERGPWFSAVFAGNDMMALGAMNALYEAGLRIPEDVSVVGYDGGRLGEVVRPALTTIRQPVYEMGRAATEQLVTLRDATSPPVERLVRLDVELIIRSTTSQVRAEAPVTQQPGDRAGRRGGSGS